MTESGEQVSDPMRGSEGLTPGKMMPTPFPQQEVGGQYPTKPFTPPTMGLEGAAPGESGGAPGKSTVSPMDLAGGQQGATQGNVSQEQIQQQSQEIQKQSANLSQMLQERYPTLSDGQKSLVSTKLNKYQSQTAKAGQILGVPPQTDEQKKAMEESVKQQTGDASPSALNQFLGMITSGDTTLRGITNQMANAAPGQLNPTDMLRAQAALASASKSVNFATAVVGQGLSFIKTIMSTQI